MPNATVSTEPEREYLKTCKGGYVDLVALPYGLILKRRENASRMSMEQGLDQKQSDVQRFDLSIAQEWTRQFEFRNCIKDHNLTDKDDNPLDFKNPLSFDVLDPKIGQEIEKAIDKLNRDEEEDKTDFTKQPTSSSTAPEPAPLTPVLKEK